MSDRPMIPLIIAFICVFLIGMMLIEAMQANPDLWPVLE
jgi:hypothetical protein